MKAQHNLILLLRKALSETFGSDVIVHIARMLIQNYDIHQRTGFPVHIPVPTRDAAEQVLRDIEEADMLTELVIILIKINTEGHMGRNYTIHALREIIVEMYNNGLVYDQVNRVFVDDASQKKTNNWGVLRDGNEYLLSYLRIDIAGSTEMVRRHDKKTIEKCYGDFRNIVQNAVDRRNGRIWAWEGDGGLAAFYFSDKYLLSVLAGIEIVHQLFIYNLNLCPLDRPLPFRVAIHGGVSAFNREMESIKKNDIIKKVIEAESRFTELNTLTVTENIFMSLPAALAQYFRKSSIDQGMTYYRYKIEVEE